MHPAHVDVELLPGEGREGAVRAQVVPDLVVHPLHVPLQPEGRVGGELALLALVRGCLLVLQDGRGNGFIIGLRLPCASVRRGC